MHIIHSVRALQTWRRQRQGNRVLIGFVPTLGALHEGHRSLLQRARQACDLVVASIFINPLQFEPSEDLQRYPRTLRDDKTMCRQEGVDLLFVPDADELYPQDFQTIVTVQGLTTRWEGERRPQHFQGVTTIVTKLLNLLQPDRAFFGQKDYQQFLIIKQLVKDLHLGTKIIRCPTIREADGLALSSRNQFLSAGQRTRAGKLYQSLRLGARLIRQGKRHRQTIEQAMATHLAHAGAMTIEYLGVCHAQTLEPLDILEQQVILLGAIRLGSVRLIDNVAVRVPNKPLGQR